MNPPIDREIFEGEIAIYWFDGEILVALSKPIRRTVQNISTNVAYVKKITYNQKKPLLIYLTNSPIPDRETQQYSREQLPEIYTAMAMVSKPGLSKFIMNLLFRLSSPPIPMKSFTDKEKAMEWLNLVMKIQ